jgi:hypothetical protein
VDLDGAFAVVFCILSVWVDAELAWHRGQATLLSEVPNPRSIARIGKIAKESKLRIG